MRKLLVLGFVLAVALLAQEGGAQPTVIATIPVPGGNLHGVGVNPNTNRIYVSRWTSNAVSVVDGSTSAVIANFGAAWAGVGVAVNPDTNRIYVSGWSAVTVHDGATNGLVATINTSGPGGGTGAIAGGVAVNPNTNLIYVAAGHGGNNMIVIDGVTNAVVATIPDIAASHGGVAVNPNTNRIYGPRRAFNDVKVIDGASNGVVATVGVGNGPLGIGVNPNTNRIYVANGGSNTVSVIDGTTDAVVATIPVGTGPVSVGVNPNTNRIYVANSDNSVSVIDGGTNAVVATVGVGSGIQTDGVDVNPMTDRVYVVNRGESTVSVIEDLRDTTPPAITLTTPAQGAVYTLNQAVLADYTCEDESGGSGLASCVGDVPDGAAIDTASVGPNTFTVAAEDNAGNIASLTQAYSVVYSFSGFFRPVDNPPTLNLAKAGSAIPVKFSLSGNQGLSILAAGYPKSKEISCDTSALLDAIEATVTAGSSSLSYDPIADQYVYVWKTDKAWAGTCRQLMVRLDDLTDHVANFKFK